MTFDQSVASSSEPVTSSCLRARVVFEARRNTRTSVGSTTPEDVEIEQCSCSGAAAPEPKTTMWHRKLPGFPVHIPDFWRPGTLNLDFKCAKVETVPQQHPAQKTSRGIIYLESQSTLENGYKYLFLWGHVPFSKLLCRVQVYSYQRRAVRLSNEGPELELRLLLWISQRIRALFGVASGQRLNPWPVNQQNPVLGARLCEDWCRQGHLTVKDKN